VNVPVPAAEASNFDVSVSAPALLINQAKLLADFTQTPSIYLTTLETNRRASINILSENLTRRRTIHHRVKSWIAPSNTPANIKMFGGKRAIHNEQLRSRAAGWVIHPYSSLRYYWDFNIMFVLLLNMVLLPLNIAFFSNNNSSWVTWMVIHTLSDVTFMTDIFFNFRTGYREEGNGNQISFVLEPKKIAKVYLKSWFVIDLISSFPFDNAILWITGGNTDSYGLSVQSAFRGFKFLRLVKLLSLLKLFRLSRIMRFVSKYEDFYNLTASVIRYMKLILMMLMVAHWNGCLGFLIPMLQDFPKDCWVSLNGLQNADWTEQYGWALFKALSHMLCIGYGRFIPTLLSEATITIFSMVTGATFYALFIAHSMAYIQQRDSARRLYQEKFQQIEEYMRYRDLPNKTRERITDYYEHKYSQKRLFNEYEILNEISKPLRDEIVNHNCRDLIECVPFLREGGPDFITQITNSLTFDVYLPGDCVIREGTIGDEMFFIRNGSVDVVAEGQHVTTLTEGDYFGEITMLTKARRVATVTAANVCDLFILTCDKLNGTLEEFPEMRCIMEKVALNRLLKLREKIPNSSNTVEATYSLKFKSYKPTKAERKDLDSIIADATNVARSKTQIAAAVSASTSTSAPNPPVSLHNKVAPMPLICPPSINIGASTGSMRPLEVPENLVNDSNEDDKEDDDVDDVNNNNNTSNVTSPTSPRNA